MKTSPPLNPQPKNPQPFPARNHPPGTFHVERAGLGTAAVLFLADLLGAAAVGFLFYVWWCVS